ncbi:MAG: NAD(P)/FAD-dependent oxidoreductase [Simkaniaceae bacterium]|nr:NAD(P)/FAD-dependent oxidoreductase [Candidatus Sacchlamyda saccharinae]
MQRIVVIGGGAAGFFAALSAKEAYQDTEVLILERSAKLLTKVRISGGGRCNVTHACFDPKELVQNYPRGSKELLGPFHRFQPKDTVEWFKKRGVDLKTEKDGRMFPTSDRSETIIDCMMQQARSLGVKIQTVQKITAIRKNEEGFEVEIEGKDSLVANRLILATGSNRMGHDIARDLGHTVQPLVPSLFTFNVPEFPLKSLAGVSADTVALKIQGSKLSQTGPLLVTHWGFSGPAALKLSAFGARYLAEKNYEVLLEIDWLPEIEPIAQFETIRKTHSTKHLGNIRPFSLPKSLLHNLYQRAGLAVDSPLHSIGKSATKKLCNLLKKDTFQVKGKTTNKEEFVTCGGVTLTEVQFKTMQSKCCEGLYFCGEILDIDGITGGFNFQNAWTTGWIAGRGAS